MKREYKSNGKGALAIQNLKELHENGQITGVLNDDQFQPASLDLTLSDEVYKMSGTVRPKPGESVYDIVKSFGKEVSYNEPFDVGDTYMSPLNERFDLTGLYGYNNPKSSTGRIDTHARVMADGTPYFDRLEKDYKGMVWLSFIPNNFRSIFEPGMSLSQLRVFNEDTRLAPFELNSINSVEPLIWDPNTKEPIPISSICDGEGAVYLSIDLGHPIGFEAIQTDDVLDLRKRDNDPKKFFSRIMSDNGCLRLEKGKFYILSTYEGVVVPPDLSAEVVALSERFGDYRSHYAGFIDTGFGYAVKVVSYGNTITLEIRTFEDVVLRHRDPICRLKFERMAAIATNLYGEGDSSSNYTVQKGARLSKHFLPWQD